MQINFSAWKTLVNGKDYNSVVWNEAGYGEHTATITIPKSFLKSETPLGFYIECIDDSAKVFIDNRFVGEMGKYPEPNSLDEFRSAARESTLFPVHFTDDVDEHTIRVKVYNFSGAGGFCPGSNPPLIGTFDALKREQQFFSLRTDTLRSVFFGIFFSLIVFFLLSLIHVLKRDNQIALRFKNGLIYLTLPFRIAFFKGIEKLKYDVFDALTARYTMNLVFCLMSSIFLLTEFSFKYLILPLSEDFYFKTPTICFGLGQLAIQLIMYLDIFSQPLFRNGKNKFFRFLEVILAIIASPAITFLFILLLMFLPPAKVWNEFTSSGLVLLFLWNTALFFMLFLQLIVQKSPEPDSPAGKILRWQKISYGFILMIMGLAVLIFKQKGTILYPYAFLFMEFFVTCYMLSSLFGKVEWPIRAIEKEVENLKKLEDKLISGFQDRIKEMGKAFTKEKEKIQKDLDDIKEQKIKNTEDERKRKEDLENELKKKNEEYKKALEMQSQRIKELISSLTSLAQNQKLNVGESVKNYCANRIQRRLLEARIDRTNCSYIMKIYYNPEKKIIEHARELNITEEKLKTALSRMYELNEIKKLFQDHRLSKEQGLQNLKLLLAIWEEDYTKEYYQNTSSS